MDNLKDKGFVIAVAVLAVGLLAFLWFWPLSKVFNGIAAEAESLENVELRMRRYLPEKVIKPTQRYVEYENEYQDRLKHALQQAVDFYDEKSTRFNEPPPFSADTSPGAFNIAFRSEVEKLMQKYSETFPPPAPTEEEKTKGRSSDTEGQRFTVHQIDVDTPEAVKLAMKHYWIIGEIFNALHELEIGGLKAVSFPAPKKDDLPVSPCHKPIRVVVRAELPIGKVKQLVTRIFSSSRVPFVDLEALALHRDPATVIDKLIIGKEYEREQQAVADREAFISLPEPPVAVSMTFVAMEWVGLPKKKTESPE